MGLMKTTIIKDTFTKKCIVKAMCDMVQSVFLLNCITWKRNMHITDMTDYFSPGYLL